jgi:hypothetical protein
MTDSIPLAVHYQHSLYIVDETNITIDSSMSSHKPTAEYPSII